MARRPIFVCILLVVAPVQTWAEGFLDLYTGAAQNRPADVNVSETSASGATSATASIDLSSSTEFGARFGAWHPTHNWIGLGIDLGCFHADGPGVSIDAIPFSILFALRAPLYATPDRRGGRLQPYAMVGVTFYVTESSVQSDGIGGSSTSWNWPLFGGAGHRVVGPYLVAGLAWQPLRKLAIFGEYRYSTFGVGFDTTNSIIFPTRNGRVDTTVKTDHLLFGASYRFGEE